MSGIATELDRLETAYAAGGYACEWLYGRQTDLSAWRAAVNQDGIKRIICDVREVPDDPLVLSVCGSLLIGANMTFAAVADDPASAQTALETWVKLIYRTAGGELGERASFPVTYQGVRFFKFRAVAPTVTPYALNQNGGAFWVAEWDMFAVWQRA